ncbi:Transcription factor MEIS1 and related HOX domain proteins [Phaffia rhodozyma]|uniref:Transcription factor MEIS1 and related HOX domain proteins n=3 Tax=Phaffia rhodozyma TaxID=264483 RepID=A0A0F7SG27_PHARH|nr:Transcription factor MEIS1 and related HOX domain proteins [Phaffia rhodozyma]
MEPSPASDLSARLDSLVETFLISIRAGVPIELSQIYDAFAEERCKARSQGLLTFAFQEEISASVGFLSTLASCMMNIPEGNKDFQTTVIGILNNANNTPELCPSRNLVSPPKILASKADSGRSMRPRTEHPSSFRHLRDWFIVHLDHPYPSAQEKEELALARNLTKNSINLWFNNMRRRSGWMDFVRTHALNNQTRMKELVLLHRSLPAVERSHPDLPFELRQQLDRIRDHVDEKGHDRVRDWMTGALDYKDGFGVPAEGIGRSPEKKNEVNKDTAKSGSSSILYKQAFTAKDAQPWLTSYPTAASGLIGYPSSIPLANCPTPKSSKRLFSDCGPHLAAPIDPVNKYHQLINLSSGPTQDLEGSLLTHQPLSAYAYYPTHPQSQNPLPMLGPTPYRSSSDSQYPAYDLKAPIRAQTWLPSDPAIDPSNGPNIHQRSVSPLPSRAKSTVSSLATSTTLQSTRFSVNESAGNELAAKLEALRIKKEALKKEKEQLRAEAEALGEVFDC